MCFTAGRVREIRWVTREMMRGRRNVGHEGWWARDGERDYSREEERKSRRENEKVYTHHLCIKGVAVLACIHEALSVWLFLNERSLEYRWSHFHSPVYWDIPFFFISSAHGWTSRLCRCVVEKKKTRLVIICCVNADSSVKLKLFPGYEVFSWQPSTLS